MQQKCVKITGSRGSWTADVEGRKLGVIHHLFRQGRNGYHAPIMPEHIGSKRLAELETALRANDLVVIQLDRDAETVARNGYVGVFWFKDLVFDAEMGISLTIVKRYASPLK